MEKQFTCDELIEIENQIDAISESLEILDPNNAIESQIIERHTYALEGYLALLKRQPLSHKSTNIFLIKN